MKSSDFEKDRVNNILSGSEKKLCIQLLVLHTGVHLIFTVYLASGDLRADPFIGVPLAHTCLFVNYFVNS